VIVGTVLAEDFGDRYVFTVRGTDGSEEQHEVIKVGTGRMRTYLTISNAGVLEVGIDYPDRIGVRSGAIPYSFRAIRPTSPGTAAPGSPSGRP
jgi:hypothetical protein